MKTSKIQELEGLITDVEKLIYDSEHNISNGKRREMLSGFFKK